MPGLFTRRISENVPRASRSASICSIRIKPGRRWMQRPLEIREAETMSFVVRVAMVAVCVLVLSTASSLAQAPGYVRVKLLKAGLMVGAGGGSGVLTYRGRDYPFRVSGLSLGVTAGGSVSRLEGWAS